MNLPIFFSMFFSACFRSLCGAKITDSDQWLLPGTVIPGTQSHSPFPQWASGRDFQKPNKEAKSYQLPGNVGPLQYQSHPHHELLLFPVVDLGLLLSLLLQGGRYCLVLPANLMGQAP